MAVPMKKITTLTLTPGDDSTLEFNKFPQVGSNNTIPYLRALRLVVNITATATGAVTQRAIYELIRNVTIEGGGIYFGPKGLNGLHLAAVGVHADGIRNIERGNGDDAVAGAGAANRTIILDFSWQRFGKKKTDYAPAIPMLTGRGCSLRIGCGSTPANFSAMAVSVEVQALIDERTDHVAVPVLTVERKGIDMLQQGTLTRGRLILALLARKTQAFASGEITSITLRGDSTILIDKVNPDDINAYAKVPANSGVQASFTDCVGQTGEGGAHVTRVFPATPGRIDIGKTPVASVFTYDIEGTMLTTDAEWLIASAAPLRAEELATQMRAMGAPVSNAALENPEDHFNPKTESKKTSVRPQLAGAMPLKLNA